MKLLIDVGNSRIKWTTLQEGVLGEQQSLYYQTENLEHTFIQAWDRLETPWQGIWVSNVAGAHLFDYLKYWSKANWNIEPTFVEASRHSCGVTNGYQYPKQLGTDRWLALIGAYHCEEGMLCVGDCGTAVTLDVVAADGCHLGGLIMPGVTTMYQSLLIKTQVLTYLGKTEEPNNNKTLLAKDTHLGINFGTLYAIIGLIESVMHRLENDGHKLTLVLTGGSTPTLLPLLQKPHRYIPDLVLRGLAIMADKSA